MVKIALAIATAFFPFTLIVLAFCLALNSSLPGIWPLHDQLLEFHVRF